MKLFTTVAIVTVVAGGLWAALRRPTASIEETLRMLRAEMPEVAAGTSRSTSSDESPGSGNLVDPKLPVYERVSGISGKVSSVGSDTLNNLMTLWTEGFQKMYPNVKIQVEGKGSSTAPPALIKGVAQFGPMSRRMKNSEIDKFEKKFGYKPMAVRVSVDALAVYVNKDCPLDKATVPQIDAVFSKNRKGGLDREIKTWGELGLTGQWANKGIRLYGRNSASGTYGYFKKVALYKGDFRSTVKEQPGSASVVRSVGGDRWGMGYSGIGYKTSQVKMLRLARKPGPDETFLDTSEKSVRSGKYPLARYLYVYINKPPNKPCNPLVREFVRFVLSRQGQLIVVKDGYMPITAKTASKMMSELTNQ